MYEEYIMSSEKIMNCGICGKKEIGSCYHFHFGTLCPQCEGEQRYHIPRIKSIAKVPAHIPQEQHKRYVMTILRRDLKIEIDY